MIDGVVTLGGKELPIRRTLGACKRFDAKYKPEMTILKLGSGAFDVEHIVYVVFLFVEAGFKSRDNAVPEWFTLEWVDDNVDMDELPKLVDALGGQTKQEPEPKKKEYKGGE